MSNIVSVLADSRAYTVPMQNGVFTLFHLIFFRCSMQLEMAHVIKAKTRHGPIPGPLHFTAQAAIL
jgi:hypothetical protein